jgi:hypothetical protein
LPGFQRRWLCFRVLVVVVAAAMPHQVLVEGVVAG